MILLVYSIAYQLPVNLPPNKVKREEEKNYFKNRNYIDMPCILSIERNIFHFKNHIFKINRTCAEFGEQVY